VSYKAIICKIENVKEHPNADRLNIGTASGYNVVISKDTVEGTVGIYFPTDGKLSFEMCKQNNLFKNKELNKDPESKGGFFEDNGRVRTVRLRSAKSEGFWMPLKGLDWTGKFNLSVGDLIDKVNGKKVCEKYYTPATYKAIGNPKKKRKKREKIKFPDFKEHFDTGQLRLMAKFIPEGATVYITEKCHGTSGRTGYLKRTVKLSLFKRFVNLFVKKYDAFVYDYVTGTRRTVVNTSLPGYRTDIHNQFKEAGMEKGETVYYEIVGYNEKNRPIMGTHTIKDKKLKKAFGNSMEYSYGCKQNERKVLIYRITNTQNGVVKELPWEEVVVRSYALGFEVVPLISAYKEMNYEDNAEVLMRACELYSQGTSILDHNHIKEGVVVRSEKDGDTLILKYKGFHFCELEGIMRHETVLVEQNDWSEERNINPYAVFDKPPAMLQITPNLGRRGQTGITVTGINFTPSKSGIVLRCDGQVMASNLISDEAGRVSASFTIPTNARNGNRIVEMADGVYSARASLQINDPLVITRIERIIENRIIRVPRAPLAQTFSFTRNQVISSIGLQFTARDPSIPVTVQIRGVTTGLPNGVVFAENLLAPNEISLSGETRIRFDDPFYAEANTSYAVVLLTNSTNYTVRTATLGKMGRWGSIITRQTYMEGVLLESSNAETWTPLNGSDLAMKIYGYNVTWDAMTPTCPHCGAHNATAPTLKEALNVWARGESMKNNDKYVDPEEVG
jgi:hypothetical protein